MNRLITNLKDLRDFLRMVEEVSPLKPEETDVLTQEGTNPTFIYDYESRQILITDEE